MSINVLLVGSGGREHALARAIAASPLLSTLVIAPGNPGTASLGRNENVSVDDHAGLLALAATHAIDLVVIGPEAPLVGGLADRCRAAGLKVFGPDAAAARLEGSKSFTKEVCAKFGIPTAEAATFTEAAGAKANIRAGAFPVVIKADGLAAGKGVVIAGNIEEADETIDAMLGGRFGEAGARLVVEEFLDGTEMSFFALCDGRRAVPFASAQDYKRVGDGDTGPNTGGMGAVSPAPMMTRDLERDIMQRIIEPTMSGLDELGTPFRGVLFAGLMIGSRGPKLIEYNVRFGDPEAEVMIPRLDQDLLPLLLACADGRLGDDVPLLREEVAVGVVMAANGYPGAPITDTLIGSLDAAESEAGTLVFHAGTRRVGGELRSAGGRVLVVTALGSSATQAQSRAYAAVDRIDWPEGFCRRDIGWQAVAREGGGATNAVSPGKV